MLSLEFLSSALCQVGYSPPERILIDQFEVFEKCHLTWKEVSFNLRVLQASIVYQKTTTLIMSLSWESAYLFFQWWFVVFFLLLHFVVCFSFCLLCFRVVVLYAVYIQVCIWGGVCVCRVYTCLFFCVGVFLFCFLLFMFVYYYNVHAILNYFLSLSQMMGIFFVTLEAVSEWGAKETHQHICWRRYSSFDTHGWALQGI